MRFSKPKFLIVTPTIPGREDLLRAAIRSVKEQIFKKYKALGLDKLAPDLDF